DTLKLFYSTNNGSSWVYYSKSALNYNYDYRKDEIDIELVFDGTDVWMYIVAGLDDLANGGTKCEFLRYNTTTVSGVWISILSFPGGSSATRCYNPRITSDNTNFTSNTYVMVLCSQDSTGGSTHYVKQKYGLLTSPFAGSVSFNFAQPNGTNGFCWMANNGTNTNTYLFGDIAYYKDDGGTGGGRIMTVYANYGNGFNNIYIAYLNGYSTFGNSMIISEPNINKNVKIAFNGGTNNRNGMITYVRQYNSSDWDIFGLRTTSGGNTIAGWTRDTIDFSSDRARTCDLVALRNASNQFKIIYAQDNPSAPAGFYRSYNGSSWSTKFQFTNLVVDTTYAKPRAGYLLGGGDDGFGVWSSIGGYNGFFSKQIQSTTGIIGNNEIPSGFSLSQNYPNPFNPLTNIKFAIPVAGVVTLKIYDIAGKEVASLVNRNMNAGVYTLDFEASNLSS